MTPPQGETIGEWVSPDIPFPGSSYALDQSSSEAKHQGGGVAPPGAAVDRGGAVGAASSAIEVKSLRALTAPGYAAGFSLMATGDIGSVEATTSGLAGSIMAGGAIGSVTSRGDVVATMTAGGSIGSVETFAGALKGAVIKASGDIGAITIGALADQAAIESSAVTAGGSIGIVKATAIRHLTITQSQFLAGDRIDEVSATSLGVMILPMGWMPAAIGETSFTARSIGTIAANNEMNVGLGLMNVRLEARTGAIDSIETKAPQGGLKGGWIVAPIGVGALHGTATSWGVGIDGGSVTAGHIDLVKGEGGPFGGAGIQGLKATVAGTVGAIEGIATNGDALAMLDIDAGGIDAIRSTVAKGIAINHSTFTARSGDIGKSGGIWATNTGTTATDNAIDNVWMRATGSIFPLTASTWGGTTIKDSTFSADTDHDNVGAVKGLMATASGVHGGWSTAMQKVTATGAAIGDVTAKVTSSSGGVGMWASTFTATTDIRSGGHYDDTGRIGDITVESQAEAYAGIDGTMFQAGAGGSIGDVRVTVAGEKGISSSKFMATNFHLDQQSFTSQIGAIVVNAGRAGGANPSSGVAALAHTRSAAVGDSWFLANAGIASVDVTSVGNALLNSWLSADYDWQAYAEPMTNYMMPYFLVQNVPGRIDHVAVTVLGQFGSGIVNSTVWAEHIGTLAVKVDSQPDGATNPGGWPLAAVAGSTVMANSGIDTVQLENAQIHGIDSVNSTIKSMVPFTTQGGVRGSVFSQPGTNFLWNIAYANPVMPAGTPAVQSVMMPKHGVYKAGDTLSVVLKFNAAVVVTGKPVIEALLPGSGKVIQIMYAGGSGSQTLTFKMSIPAGLMANQALMANQGVVFGQKLVLEGGTIKGKKTGADVPLELPALAAAVADRIRIDSTPPQLMQTALWTSSAPKGMTMITQSFTFNEAVRVAGRPIVTALVGGVPVHFTYKTGAGTKTLTFTAMVPMAVGGMAIRPLMSLSFGQGASLMDTVGNMLDARSFSQSWMMLGATTIPVGSAGVGGAVTPVK